jgi:hypothetical protein
MWSFFRECNCQYVKIVKRFRTVKSANVTVEAYQQPDVVSEPNISFRTYILVCIVMRRGCACLTRQILDEMTGFIETFYTPLGTMGHYSAIVDLHTLQFTVTNFSVFTSRILATDL